MKCGIGTGNSIVPRKWRWTCDTEASIALRSRECKEIIYLRCEKHSLALITTGRFDIMDLEEAEKFCVVAAVMKS